MTVLKQWDPTANSGSGAWVDLVIGSQGPQGLQGVQGVPGAGSQGVQGTIGDIGVVISASPVGIDHGKLWVDTTDTVGNGIVYPTIINITSNYTIKHTDAVVFCNASGGEFTITLPSLTDPTKSVSGRRYFIKKIDNTTNRISSSGIIEGDSNVKLGPGIDDMTIVSDGTNYYYEGF